MTLHRLLIICWLTIFASCGGDAVTAPDDRSDAAGAAFALSADPGEAVSVIDVKRSGPSDAVVIVQGRVQERTKGFGILKLMDTALHYCRAENGCPTPWDYCCDTREVRREHALLVEFHGADKSPIETVGLPNTRLLDLLKVRGKLTKNEYGSLVFIADGFWQVARPELPSGLNWPQ